jgi:PAS domain S-box-containing protein
MTDTPESEFPFRTDLVLDTLPNAFQAFDREWRYIYLNGHAEAMLGRTREELLGKVFWDVFPGAVGTPLSAKYQEAMAGDRAVVFEDFQPQEGTWLEVSLQPYPGGLGVFTRDVTARKRAEAQTTQLLADLRDERDTLDAVHEIGRLLSAELNLDRLVQAATDAATSLTGAEFGAFFYNIVNEQGESYQLYTISGVPREAFSSFPMPRATNLFGPTFRGEGTIRIGDVRNDPRYGTMAPYHGMPPGHLPVCSYLAVPVMSRSGEVLGGLFFGHSQPNVFTEKAERNVQTLVGPLAIAMDNARLFGEALRAMEEARRANELQAATEALRQSEERFRLLVEQVKDYAIFLLDPQGNIATWNEGAERFMGYTASEIIGQHFSRFYTAEDIARRHPWNELEITVLEGRYEEEGWRLRKDGSRFWTNVVITALRDAKGELSGFAKVTRDLTEQRAREREQAEAQLAEQQRRLLKEMLASVTGGRLILCDDRSELPEHLMLVTAPDEPSTIDLDKPMLRWLRHRALDAARQAGMDKERMGKLVTAVNEAAMNAIVHAGGGTATVEVDPQSGTVQVWVEDAGPGFDMSRLPKATLDRGFTTAGTLGHGFKLVLATADKVWLLTGPTGTTLVLQQARDEPLPSWFTDQADKLAEQEEDGGSQASVEEPER